MTYTTEIAAQFRILQMRKQNSETSNDLPAAPGLKQKSSDFFLLSLYHPALGAKNDVYRTEGKVTLTPDLNFFFLSTFIHSTNKYLLHAYQMPGQWKM